MASLKNVYVYSENNIFIFLAERAHRHNNGGYDFIKYIWNAKPMKKLEKSIAVCLYVGMDIRIDWQPSKHFARDRPTHLHVSNPIYNIHCPFNVTKLVYINNWVDEKKFLSGAKCRRITDGNRDDFNRYKYIYIRMNRNFYIKSCVCNASDYYSFDRQSLEKKIYIYTNGI